MQKLLRNARPDRLEDLIALVALYRPGPLQSGLDTDFVRRKHGLQEVTYLHPLLEPILSNSYGIILYQEQVMKITQVLAGFSAGQAETAMKAMSKKKADVMEKLHPVFIEGAMARGVDRKVAQEIYDVMYNFAKYGFGLNHSAAYAVLSYHTAYLKANFPAEFMATNLSSIVDKRDKLALYINEVRRLGIELLPPSINESEGEFLVEEVPGANGSEPARAIRMGLEAIRNVSRPCIELLLRARASGGRFRDFADFMQRVFGEPEAQTISRTAIESLIKAGALDCLPGHRAQFLVAVEPAIQAAAALRREKSSGQVSLFGDDAEDDVTGIAVQLPVVPEFNRQEALAMERDLLGVYVSDHPLNESARALRNATTVVAAELHERRDREDVTVGGIISAITLRTTRDNRQWASVTLEDLTGTMNVAFFPRNYESNRELLEKDRIVIIKGRASVREQMIDDEDAPATVEVHGESVTAVETRQAVHIPSVHVKLIEARRTELMLMRQLFQANPGTARLMFHITHGGQEERILSGLRVEISPKLLQEVQSVASRVGGQVWVD